MQRREFMLALGAGLAALSGCAPLAHDVPRISTQGRLFIPGYKTADALIDGRPALRKLDATDRMRAEDTTLLTRIDTNGGVARAIFPITGHDVAIAPDGALGFFGRMGASEGRAAHHIAFDPATLEEVGRGRPLGPEWRGGGHGVYLLDGSAILTAERAPIVGWTGRLANHYGRIALRDPKSLRVIDSISCHGIDPHEVRLLPGGRQLAVANYGSVARPGDSELGVPRQVEEASLTVVDLASGELVAKRISADPEVELRHLALSEEGGFFAIRVHLAPADADAPWRKAGPLDEPDRTADIGESYLPAGPLIFPGIEAEAIVCGTPAEVDGMRHGLSVEFDPVGGEFIATYPSSHRLMVFDAATGRVRREVDTARLGLPYPCGLALMPDGLTYAVAGYGQDVMLFRRGTHQPLDRLPRRVRLFGHSHMTVA